MDVHNTLRHREFRFFIGLEGKRCNSLCGKTGRAFISEVAANFQPGHDEFEIFNDSGSEDEFEGFDLEDRDENIVRPQFDSLSIENWREGDRKFLFVSLLNV